MAKFEKVEVITYRLTNGETITGILDKVSMHTMGTVQTLTTTVATEFVIPVVFHMDDKGIPAYVSTDEAAYPTIQVFMAHVMGKASHGTFEIRESVEGEGSLVTVQNAEDAIEVNVVPSSGLIRP